MNDFFTELDADLDGGKTSFREPKKQTAKAKVYEPPRPIPNKPFPKEKAAHRDKRPVEPIPGHILDIRSQLLQSGVVVLVFRADERTKTLLGHLKLETRGFAHSNEVREVHKSVIKRARASYEDTVRDIPDIEEKDLLKIIRQDLEIFLLQRFDRNPVVIPIIVYV